MDQREGGGGVRISERDRVQDEEGGGFPVGKGGVPFFSSSLPQYLGGRGGSSPPSIYKICL